VQDKVEVTVYYEGKTIVLETTKGTNLRKLLLENGLSPYSKLNQKLNCGGNGICATCGVFILKNKPKPTHWHDWLANKFYYPRLSCQIVIEHAMVIEIPKKLVWGSRRKPKN
jgi:ferredoxin